MRKYKSKIAAAVHEPLLDARDAGVIDKRTMRQFDESCLTPAELLSAREIVRPRNSAIAQARGRKPERLCSPPQCGSQARRRMGAWPEEAVGPFPQAAGARQGERARWDGLMMRYSRSR